ncbi:MAG: phosphatidylserine decarboxylase family protein [Cyclobacteriaceae bacterium]|nr:phosphatidylserine decarboxylase family protein [Cyclobacteriaceae bacterium]
MTSAPFRVGKWLPSDEQALENWIAHVLHDLDPDAPLHPDVLELKDLIEGNADLFMLFHLMFNQVPHKPTYNRDPSGSPQVRNYLVMLQLLNRILTTAPEYNKTVMVGCPINAILDWPMGTKAGFAVFLHEKVNHQLKKILNSWAMYLSSPESRYVLNQDPHKGWLGRDAMEAMPGFEEDYLCQPDQPFHGFRSWDDFFTRQFRPGRRPVVEPDNSSAIANACESAPYRLAHGVQRRDRFWIKAQPYSLEDMLRDDPTVDRFVGGTVYQAFLSPTTYHQWHAPVSGKVIKVRHIDGTYYSETLAEGFDPSGPSESQAYLTSMATRTLIFIEADNPDIGLVCFMGVGMSEVSSCEALVHAGQYVEKGDTLGMFHFGGSTYCLVFGPDVKLDFDLHGQTPGLHAGNIRVNEVLARVK